MSDMVRMNVARNITGFGIYVFSPMEITERDDDGVFMAEEHTEMYPDAFAAMFDFHLDPGQGPVVFEFPKIKGKVIK